MAENIKHLCAPIPEALHTKLREQQEKSGKNLSQYMTWLITQFYEYEQGGNSTMAGKPLMTPDELKALPKGEFVVMKTGRHPMRTRLRLFLEWGITFEEPYIVPPREDAQVRYAGRRELMNSIMQRYEFAQSRSGAMPLDSEKGERNKNTAGMKT